MTVYFARARGFGRIKIGYVQDVDPADIASGVARRLGEVGLAFGCALDLVATTPGSRRLERWFHVRHAATALGREWFALSPLLMADLVELRAGRRIEGQPPPKPYDHLKHYREWRQVEGLDGVCRWYATPVRRRIISRIRRDFRDRAPMVQP